MVNQTSHRIYSRAYNGHTDFMRIRQFLLDCYEINGTYHNWEIRRWEGMIYWGEPTPLETWAKLIHIWEDENEEIVGVVHPEGTKPGNAWLQVHPYFRYLEDEMLQWAEKNLAADGSLLVEAFDYDTRRQELLLNQGYQKTDWYGFLRWREVNGDIPKLDVPWRYRIRSLHVDDWQDTARWADVINSVFAHAKATPEGIRRFQSSPSYQHHLHIIAEAEDGRFVSFAGLTIEEKNRTAVFEPVGTRPDYRGKGLAKAVMSYGMWRLLRSNISIAYVGTGDTVAANKLYESMGFNSFYQNFAWKKQI